MSSIAAGLTSGTALVNTGDTSGTLQLQTNGTTPALTLNTSGALGVGSSPGYGSSGQVLISGGSGAAPSWGAVSLPSSSTITSPTLVDPSVTGTIVEDIYTITDGAAFEVDPGNGSIQLITLGASRTPKATNFAAGEAITLMINDGSAYTITWTDSTWGGSGVVWMTNSGSAPTLATTGYTTIVLWKVGTQVYGARVGDNA